MHFIITTSCGIFTAEDVVLSRQRCLVLRMVKLQNSRKIEMTKLPSKPITMDDVARLASVSKPTVSRALSGHANVTPATREKVLKVARDHGYAVNRNAQKLREKQTNAVAVILDFSSHRRQRIADPFIFELLAGVSEALSIRKQDLLLSPSSLTDAGSYQDLVNARVVDGFIFLGQGDKKDLLEEMAKLAIPFVVWGAPAQNSVYCTVGSDNYLGGALAGERFVKNRRKNILFVGDTQHSEIKLRRDGLVKGLATADYDVRLTDLKSTAFSFQDSHRAMLKHLEEGERPDGIFAYSDTSAMAIISAMAEHCLQPIIDYHLVGYNDIVQSSHFSPPITTVKQDTFLAGALIVEKFVSLIAGNMPASSTIPTELIVRNT